MNKPVSCDLFCRVVDNFGDAGVCWRLARQLAAEHGWEMRLWIDDLAPLARLRPGLDPASTRQQIDGVDVRAWTLPFPPVPPARVVIEAFACELPPAHVEAMAQRHTVWVNLEYLSAEDWVTGCHGLASPHPTLPLIKHFFFPGFVAGSGGLIRERHADFTRNPPHQHEFTVSLFCYAPPALPRLLDAWAAGAQPVRCLVADGLPQRQVAAWLGSPLAPGVELQRGALTLCALPFLAQPDYDRLLGSCDLNFVRGEDSFVRAQWAERPFVWQIYRQDDNAHLDKLDAFLARYCANLDTTASGAVVDFWHDWNTGDNAAATWPALRAALPTLAMHAAPWAKQIASPGNLAENLALFCLNRL